MKHFKNVLFVVLLLSSKMLMAETSTISEMDKKDAIINEVHQLLKQPHFHFENEFMVRVKFVINSKNEVVVLSVDTDKKAAENFIKDRLNYKSLTISAQKETFVLPIKFISGR